MDLENLRREYLKGGLRRNDLNDNPFDQFDCWMAQAVEAGISDPTAMVLATADASGQPSQRIVLLKQRDHQGFVFFTNYDSHKGRDIAANPKASLLFPWHFFERQVIVQGHVERLDREASQRYFASRPRGSQIAAWASRQSQPVDSRASLDTRFAEAETKWGKDEIPLPDFWGGYRVVPELIEFWQGGGQRLHDRFTYRRLAGGQWDIQRLQP
ncbi:pyridoxamine 5'-phosphate oxidase [Marinimicrobium alkaliphilum]|uniref:pyridoxamine 5'-phosphate oxidase n=1 Tax=Marinimicrobium alkaliphilum TaxID=2202654 RepID=UPI000DB9CD58|nr:pyridoxamine 5'-phosphate oxidase [Marinimicrobium alkaliphilum]